MIVVMDALAGFVALRCRYRDLASGKPPATPSEHTISGKTLDDDEILTPAQILKQVPLARYLAVLVILKTIVVLLIEFEWKSKASAYYSSEDDLASFFGVFYASHGHADRMSATLWNLASADAPRHSGRTRGVSRFIDRRSFGRFS